MLNTMNEEQKLFGLNTLFGKVKGSKLLLPIHIVLVDLIVTNNLQNFHRYYAELNVELSLKLYSKPLI